MINNIQVLRGLAALLVVWAHAREILPEGMLPSYFPAGFAGVDVFFVISGFVMIHTTRGDNVTAGNFLLRRFFRVAPIYYIFVLLIVAVWAAAPGLLKSTFVDAASVLKTLLFIPYEKSVDRIYPVYFVGWTLNYEMFFYVVFGLALAVSKKHRLLITSIIIAALVGYGTLVDQAGNGVLFYFYSRPIMLDFLMGMLIAKIYPVITNSSKDRSLIYGAILGMGVVGLFTLSVISPISERIAPATGTFLIFGLPATAIVLGAVGLEHRGHRIVNRPMLEVGAASYSLYLMHFFIVAVGIAAANRLNLSPVFRIVAVPILIGISALAAIVFHRMVEMPIGRFLNRYERKQAVRGVARTTRPVGNAEVRAEPPIG